MTAVSFESELTISYSKAAVLPLVSNLFDYFPRLCPVPVLFAVSFYRLDSISSRVVSTHTLFLTVRRHTALPAAIHFHHCLMPTLTAETQAHAFQNLSPKLVRGYEKMLEHHHHYFLDFTSYHCKVHHLFPHPNGKLHYQVTRCCFAHISDLSRLLLAQT